MKRGDRISQVHSDRIDGAGDSVVNAAGSTTIAANEPWRQQVREPSMSRAVVRKLIYKPLVELPPLSPDVYEGLRMSIAASGVFVPIVVWPKGRVRYIVDGSCRKAIADELGYDCPELLRPDLTQEEARIMARALNLARRQLTTEQKRKLIADQLGETPNWSLRRIAKMLGVTHPTVASVRAELESTGKLYQLDQTLGQDGKYRPRVNHERYTPTWLVDAVRRVLGRIDLDPASSSAANATVKAASFFTKRTDGLKRPWHGRVFLNPPFDDWPSWAAKLDHELKAGHVKQAVVVGPANISAFRPLLKRGGVLLVPDEGPKYYDPSGNRLVDPPFGSLIGYVGQHRDRFVTVFGTRGLILQQIIR